MSDSTSDCGEIAAKLFARHGLDFSTARRAEGWTNAVYINRFAVLRIATEPGRNWLTREAALADRLPDGVGYPRVLGSGEEAGHAWMLCENAAGENLREAWPRLTWIERLDAARRLWVIIDLLRSTPIENVREYANRSAWYDTLDKADAEARLRKYEADGVFTHGQSVSLQALLSRFFAAYEHTPAVLNHGDITMENILRRPDGSLSLIDFEHAAVAPAEMDLRAFLALCLIPDEDALDFTKDSGCERYRNAVFALTLQEFADEDARARLLGFELLYRMRFLAFWLEGNKGPLEQCEVHRRLVRLTACDMGAVHAEMTR